MKHRLRLNWISGLLTLVVLSLCYQFSDAAISRESMKCLALTPYYPGAGILFSTRKLVDIDYLNPAMLRVEIMQDGDDVINYCAYDYIVDRAGSSGIQILGLLDYATVSASGPDEWETDAYRNRFVAKVQELVAHYKDREYPIKHWEIWNEEDLDLPEFNVRIEPRPYARLLTATYEAIKALDPEATVILGGISPKNFEYDTNYLSDVYNTPEMQAYYQANSSYPFDAVACHPYPEIFNNPTTGYGLDDVLNDRIKAIMNTHGDRYKKVWLTEMGWNSASYRVTEYQQAQYLTASFEMLDDLRDPAYPSDPPYIERYFWFQYQDFGTIDYWGLRTADLSREKPAYSAYLNLTSTGPEPPPGTSDPGENPPVLGTSDAVLNAQVSASDLINGQVGQLILGGFHEASQGNIANLTNGVFESSGLMLVLRDYPYPEPCLRVRYQFDSPVDLTEVNLYAGHFGDIGNRAFQSNDIYINGTLAASELNTGNYDQLPPGGSAVSLVQWLPGEGETFVATNVSTIDVAFYAVASIDEGYRDRWDPCSDPIEDTDGIGQAYVAPIIKEIDVFGIPHQEPSRALWEVY